MIEILFRGKRLDNGEWVEGFYVHLHDTHKKKESHRIYPENAKEDFGVFYLNWFEVDPETVGRYTGLDKNGKKIFEGDIVDASDAWWDAAGPAGHDSPIIAVEWNDRICGFDPFADYDCDCGVYIESGECQVIGNIYDDAWMLTTDPSTLRLALGVDT